MPKLINARKIAARRYVLIRGLFHLCLVSTTRLATGPRSSELPRIGVCKWMGCSLEDGGLAISISVVVVVILTRTNDAMAYFSARICVWNLGQGIEEAYDLHRTMEKAVSWS